jgi:hypothetical protein
VCACCKIPHRGFLDYALQKLGHQVVRKAENHETIYYFAQIAVQLSSELIKYVTVHETDHAQSPHSQRLLGGCTTKYLRNQPCLLATIQPICGFHTVDVVHYLRKRLTGDEMRFDVQQ